MPDSKVWWKDDEPCPHCGSPYRHLNNCKVCGGPAPIPERERGWHGADEPCPHCGSWYRIGDKCNICGAQVPIRQPSRKGFCEGKEAHGRLWDSKLHRYTGMAA